jgi:hypothetical protein
MSVASLYIMDRDPASQVMTMETTVRSISGYRDTPMSR